jgi:hypothetical protein
MLGVKHRFNLLYLCLFCALLAGGNAYASQPAGRSKDSALNDELKQRFLAAVARAREPQSGISEWQRLAALRYIEKTAGLNLGVARMMEDAAAREPGLMSGMQRTNPRGIAKHPKAMTLSFDVASKQTGNEFKMNGKQIPADIIKNAPQVKMASFFILAASIIDHCRPEEKKTNREFLKRILAQPWPEGTGKMMAGALALRLSQHECISRTEFEAALKPLLPSIRGRMTKPDATSVELSGTLYFLAEADAMNGISEEQLLRFARAQSDEGTWADEQLKASSSAYASFGAAVLSYMLKERGVRLTNDDVTLAYKNPPKLSLLKSNPSAP